jgi:outer membrane receptor protein involved in Fe transport
MNRKVSFVVLSSTAIAIALLLPNSASAQATSDTDTDARSTDIVVTASRRNVDLQDLPAAVTAIGADRISELGARAKDDLVYVSPGLSFTDSGAGRQNFTIRGVQALSGEATTAFYVDETPVSRGTEAQFDIRLFDVDRVEVLRGPQGTLFGASSMGGAIRVITRKPDTEEFAIRTEGRLSTTRNGHVGYDINAAINIPIIADKLAVRVVGFKERVSGFVDNFDLSIDAGGNAVVGALAKSPTGDRDLYGVRVSTRLEATENLAITASFNLQDSKFIGVSGEDIDPTDLTSGLVEGALRQSRAFIERPGNRSHQYNLTAEYTGDAVSIVSSTSYSRSRDEASEDFTRRFGPAFGLPELDVSQVARGWEFTQEARIFSTGDRKFNWLLGGFYTDSNVKATQLLRDRSTPAFDSLFTFISVTPNSEYSFFGELSYKITDRLTATGGLRRYSTTRKFNNTTLAGPLTGPNDDISVGNATKTGLTYKALLSYEASNDVLLYLSATTGYRSGGPNSTVPSPTGPITPAPFSPDKVTQFELGWKASLLDNRITLNGAAYYLLWNNIQIPVIDPTGDFTFTGNGGKAHTAGLELELSVEIANGFTINSNVSIQEAKFDEAVATLDVIKGDRLPNVPKFGGSISANYETAIGATSKFYAQGIYSYAGKTINNVTRDANGNIISFDNLGGYGLLNLSAGIRRGPIEFGLFARNLTDERGLIGRRRSGAAGVFTQQYVAPRVLGIEFKADF